MVEDRPAYCAVGVESLLWFHNPQLVDHLDKDHHGAVEQTDHWDEALQHGERQQDNDEDNEDNVDRRHLTTTTTDHENTLKEDLHLTLMAIINLSIFLFSYLSIYLTVCLSVYLSIIY